MKIIEVSSAIIIKSNKIFVTQRGYGDFKDKWEFPGGKLEQGESGEDCIVREIKEELDADIRVVKFLNTIEYKYPTFHLIMHNYICELKNSHLSLLEHEAAKFVDIADLNKIDFLPADLLILEDLIKYLS
ncbi:MAG: (deoxy)nucleoside triphosphate pyrophosphohydrolase [Bacilli bacterium]|nr:(deoxy)nucleoside triphosphate pyrophosphohydrolase [Bacilli bacterium]